MKIVNAKWKITAPVSGATYTIKGTGPNIGGSTLEIPATAATLVGTNVLEINDVGATVAFETSKVKFFNTFDIDWKISVNGGAYQNAGKSQNPIYACLRGLDGDDLPKPYYTVVHVACASDGATNADQAVINTWGRLSGPSNLNGWNEVANDWTRPLYYYKPGTTFDENPVPASYAEATETLLQSGLDTGQCITWAMLMYDALRLNGAAPEYILATVEDTDFQRFLVKDWTPNAFAGTKEFFFEDDIPDMVPVPSGGVYGDFTNQATLKGQNSGNLAPSQKVFGNHQFLKYTPSATAAVYYDPSYGKTYSSQLDFQQKAVGGLAKDIGNDPFELEVIETPAANAMKFTIQTILY